MSEPLTDAPAAPADPNDYVGKFMEQHNLSLEPVAGDLPVPSGETPVTDTPAATGTEAADPVKTESKSRPEAATRQEGKRKVQEELTRYQQQVKELEERDAETKRLLEEREARLVEFRNLAEERESRINEIQKNLQADTEKDWQSSISELPEIQEAQKREEQALANFFPRSLSNLSEDEADTRFSIRDLRADQMEQVNRQIASWARAEFNSEASADIRAKIQHVAISNIASVIGVKPEAFTEETINGQVFRVLRPSHPVYGKLSDKIPNLVDARVNLYQTREKATQNTRESFLSAARHRQENTRQMYKNAGVGIDADELSLRLRSQPDNLLLRTMQILSQDPELLKEVQDNREVEASLHGFFTPKLSLAETDPNERAQVSNAHMQRIGQRAIHAPMAVPMQKMIVRQGERIKELEAKLKYYMEEDEEKATQNEPGLATGGTSSTPQSSAPRGKWDDNLDSVAAKLGLTTAR